MVVKMPKINLEIPINGGVFDEISIPPACESYQCFTIQSATFPCIIESKSILEHCIIPTTIVYNKHAFIRITNTSNKTIQLKNNTLYGQKLNDFDIYTGDQFEKFIPNYEIFCMKPYYRTVMEILTDKIPKNAPQKLFDLCFQFMPIFYDAKNKLTINNFYSQDIRLSDNTPVFAKNYRLPQNSKD